jgi:hypothetical protein
MISSSLTWMICLPRVVGVFLAKARLKALRNYSEGFHFSSLTNARGLSRIDQSVGRAPAFEIIRWVSSASFYPVVPFGGAVSVIAQIVLVRAANVQLTLLRLIF